MAWHFENVPALVACAVLTIAPAAAARTVVIVPGARYHASWIQRLLLGSQWRDLWTTPIQVEILNLDTFDGGLTPGREGGGLQTKNLHFRSARDNHWVFRSVDKDPTRILSPDVRESLLGELAQDLTSTVHPAGALVAA